MLDLQANKEISSKHLGQIADLIAVWEGAIADELDLKEVDVESIKAKHPTDLKLQS